MTPRKLATPKSPSLPQAGKELDRQRSSNDLRVATLFVTVCTVAFALSSDRLMHWFVIPVWACGVLVSLDAVRWARGRIDLFDPQGVLGALGVHFFFFAPLLHVSWQYWMEEVRPPEDWRPWLAGMATLNFLGLLLYRASSNFAFKGNFGAALRSGFWRLTPSRFFAIAFVMLVLSAVTQVIVYSQFGGISGYVSAFESKSEAFTGMGWIFLFSESFPICAMMLFALLVRMSGTRPSWLFLGFVLVVLAGAALLFGGLRGSRANTVWAMFWGVGILHLYVRKVPRPIAVAGLACLVLFMYGYGFFKAEGLRGLQYSLSNESRQDAEAATGRTIEASILGDLGRSDVQAFILYRQVAGSDYKYAWGRTYLGGVSILIPVSVWPDRPETKVVEGTDLLFGQGSFYRSRGPLGMVSTRVYGLAGEAMLNFGPLAVPLAFIPLGLLVGLLRRSLQIWSPDDVRLMLFPFLVNLSFWVLVADSDNVVFFFVKHGAVAAFLAIAGSTILFRSKARKPAAPPTRPAAGSHPSPVTADRT